MRLCYRGVEYDYNPLSLEVKDSELTGRYRGHLTHFSYVSHVPVPQPVANLTYRGVGYTTTAQGQVQAPARVTEPRRPVFQSIKSTDNSRLKARRHLLHEATEAHRINIQRSLQHRMDVAKAQGDTKLMQQLEAELNQTVSQ
ncbi:MAG: DUF4278 domain-containing protein [Nodosilinea sp.]